MELEKYPHEFHLQNKTSRIISGGGGRNSIAIREKNIKLILNESVHFKIGRISCMYFGSKLASTISIDAIPIHYNLMEQCRIRALERRISVVNKWRKIVRKTALKIFNIRCNSLNINVQFTNEYSIEMMRLLHTSQPINNSWVLILLSQFTIWTDHTTFFPSIRWEILEKMAYALLDKLAIRPEIAYA